MKPSSLSQLKIRALVKDGELLLAQGPHADRARADSEYLLLHVFRRNDPERNRAWLLAHRDHPASGEDRLAHRALLQRRLAGEPIQYITGEQEFYGLPFCVSPAVLIPRPETELLVEQVVAWARGEAGGKMATPRIVDVGTGSGAIAVALARALPQAAITASDLSDAALSMARANAARNGVGCRIRFLCGDLLAPVAGERFEVVVSNPPYVAGAERDALAVEVREHEPEMALFAGEDGLEIYRRLIPAAHAALAAGGLLALELGCGQDEAVTQLLAATGFAAIEIDRDLRGIPRLARARRW